MADLDLVKNVATAIARLRRGEISGIRFVGLADADPERQTLVQELIEDHSSVLGLDVLVHDLPNGNGFELARPSAEGEVVEIDVGTNPADGQTADNKLA